MLKRSKFNKLVEDISKSTGVNLSDTSKVLNSYIKSLAEELEMIEPGRESLCYGIMKIDSMIKLHPGLTLIYSADDMGKTSVLKTMAMNLAKQGQTVLYLDAENKLYLHQLDELKGVYFSTTNNVEPVRQLIDTGLLDAIIIDTISSMPHNSLKAFMFSTKKKVPFIIMAAQMRVDIDSRRKVPACSDSILSSSHTHIYLTESERISFERVDMRRVQFSIMKYEPDSSVIRKRSSFVIRENMVSNFWSSIDHLHSVGMIRAYGQDKYLDGKRIGKYSEIIGNSDVIHDLIRLSWNTLSEEDVDFGIFCEYGKSLLDVSFEGDEGEPDDIPTGEEELSVIDSG